MAAPDQCGACLSTDRRMYPLGRLSATYRLLSEATSPDTRLCWECRAVLDRLRRFRLQVSQASYFMQRLAEHGLRLRGKSLSRLKCHTNNAYYLECKEAETDMCVDITETVYIPMDLDNASCTTDDGLQYQLHTPSNLFSGDQCEDNLKPSFKFIIEKTFDEDVQVLVLNSSSNDMLGQNIEQSIECVITNNLDITQLEMTLDHLKDDKQISILKEITLKRPAELLTIDNIKNKVLTSNDMLAIFGTDWKLELENIAASNQQLKSVDQWLLDKLNMITYVTSNYPLSFKPEPVLNQKGETLKLLSPVSIQFKREPGPARTDEWIEEYVKTERVIGNTTIEVPEAVPNQKQASLKPSIPVSSQFKAEQMNQNESIELSIKPQDIIEKSSVNVQKTVLDQKQDVLQYKQYHRDTTEEQHTSHEQINKNVNTLTRTDNLHKRVNRVQHTEKTISNDTLVLLGSKTYSQNIPILLSDDDDDYRDDEIGYRDDETGSKDETFTQDDETISLDKVTVSQDDKTGNQDDVEEEEDIMSMLDRLERDGVFFKKGRPDKYMLDKLHPMDQYGSNSSGRGITYKAIAKMRRMLKEGKVERFKGTISDVNHFRNRRIKSLKGALCKFCNVRLKTDLNKHVQEYHSEAAGPHVCDICSRHFLTEEEQRAHYQRHFYMFRCKMGCVRSIFPSIWEMVLHVQQDERVQKRRAQTIPANEKRKEAEVITLETLDANDRFGMVVTSRKIDDVKKYEEEGKVERFVATLSELMEYRKLELHQYNKNCVLCVVKIRDEDLEEHKRLYHSEAAGPHVCEICSCHFRTEEAQSAHYQRHFNMYRCRVGDCRYATPSINKIWFHVFTKEKRGVSVKAFDGKCDICGGIYLNQCQFKYHYEQHISKEKYECDVCEKVYNTRRQILVHLARHNKKYMCEQCGYRTDKKITLKTHATSHLTYDERQFKCSLCKKRFTTLAKLTEHKARHDEKSFLCAYCELVYSNKYELNYHVKKKHPDKVTIVQSNSRTKETQRRTKSAFRNPRVACPLAPTPTSFPCDVCAKEFKKKALLIQHSRVHNKEWPFKCDVCGKGRRTKRSLEIHLILHRGENPYECDKCDKKFSVYSSLKWHRQSNHSNRSHECAVCGFKAKFASYLTKHMQKHLSENQDIAKTNEDNAVIDRMEPEYGRGNTSAENEQMPWNNKEPPQQ